MALRICSSSIPIILISVAEQFLSISSCRLEDRSSSSIQQPYFHFPALYISGTPFTPLSRSKTMIQLMRLLFFEFMSLASSSILRATTFLFLRLRAWQREPKEPLPTFFCTSKAFLIFLSLCSSFKTWLSSASISLRLQLILIQWNEMSCRNSRHFGQLKQLQLSGRWKSKAAGTISHKPMMPISIFVNASNANLGDERSSAPPPEPELTKKAGDILSADSDQEQYNQQSTQTVEKIIYSEYQTMFDEFNNSKFELIAKKMQKEINRLEQEVPIKTISVNSLLKDLSLQSIENLRNLQREFSSPLGRRNVEKIDTMLVFNKFFVILSKDKRFKIYDHCEFLRVKEGDQIYKEGDVEDYMYIVVKGCIKQYDKKNTSYHNKLTVNFLSFYEGSSFGEAQLAGEKEQKSKRYNSTIAAENTYLLRILNDFYRDLITNLAEDDFDKKISALLTTTMFCETSKFFVTPLMSTLDKRVLSYGEILIRQGDPVDKLYFIGEGNLQVTFIERAKRTIKHENIIEKPRNFSIKDQFSSKKPREKNYSIHKSFYYQKQFNSEDKEFLYGHKKLVGEELEYNDQILFEELRSGDFLGGKSFLSPELRAIKSDKSQHFDPDLNAKLSVICSSTETVVYFLDEKKFFSLSENLQKVITESIMSSKYFDEKDSEAKIYARRQWKKYTEGLISKVISEKRHRNHSFRL